MNTFPIKILCRFNLPLAFYERNLLSEISVFSFIRELENEDKQKENFFQTVNESMMDYQIWMFIIVSKQTTDNERRIHKRVIRRTKVFYTVKAFKSFRSFVKRIFILQLKNSEA